MKERPILFSGPMVRAILEGRKTQTRRVVKFRGNLPEFMGGKGEENDLSAWDTGYYDRNEDDHVALSDWKTYRLCPFGQPGDRLWVRETCNLSVEKDAVAYLDFGGKIGPTAPVGSESWAREWKTCPSIHMPRWASRITLEITGVRVERLQEISEEDARAEGMVRGSKGYGVDLKQANSQDHCLGTGRFAFANLINKLHGGENWNLECDRFGKIRPTPLWDQNPWVWVIELKRL